jgi:acyl-CoA thioesterase FadM
MNLWFRLLWLLVTARWRAPIVLPGGFSTLRFQVWPTDLDPSLHMNNGRYLTLMDLGRLHFMIGTGLWRPLLKHRWTPIASAILIRFRRELRTLDRFRLETRIIGWAEASVVMEQLFIFEGGPRDGEVAARALFKGGLYDRKGRTFVPVLRLMAELGIDPVAPEPSPEVTAFLAADNALRRPQP